MNLQADLEDELLLLRPMQERDYKALYKIARDPSIWEQHQCRNRYQEEVFRAFFREALKSESALTIICKREDKIIGSSRFKLLENDNLSVEIGWTFLGRKYWGGLYNKALKKLMIDHAFGFVREVFFFIDRQNIRSRRASEKIGARKLDDSTLYKRYKRPITDCIYRISIEDWLISSEEFKTPGSVNKNMSR